MTNTVDIHFTAPMPKISFTAKQRANFTHYHLNSAKMFANHAIELEKYCNDDQQKKNEVHKDYISYVSSSVLASVAALESNINEMFIDFREKYEAVHKNTDSNTNKMIEAINAFSVIKDMFVHIIEKPKPVLSKYKTMSLLIKERNIISEKEETIIKFIIRLRNNIVHFMPEWDNDLNEHESIEKTYKNQYSGKFSLSPIYNSGAMFFPYLCLSADCSSWCLSSVKKFIENYKSNICS
jgi:uncharacterized protein YutE (UPF0331/DUF86 family)